MFRKPSQSGCRFFWPFYRQVSSVYISLYKFGIRNLDMGEINFVGNGRYYISRDWEIHIGHHLELFEYWVSSDRLDIWFEWKKQANHTQVFSTTNGLLGRPLKWQDVVLRMKFQTSRTRYACSILAGKPFSILFKDQKGSRTVSFRSVVGCWVVRMRYGWTRLKIIMADVVLLC